MNGKNRRSSTKEESLQLAKEFAEDWYLKLRGKHAKGELPNDRTFEFAAEKFLLEFEADTMGSRNPKCLKNHQNHVRLHLSPFFGKYGLSEITTTRIQEYRLARMQSTYQGAAAQDADDVPAGDARLHAVSWSFAGQRDARGDAGVPA